MKTAVVTGASKGLGLEWCRQLAALNYRVILTAREAEKASQAAAGIGTGEIHPYPLEVTREDQIAGLAGWLGERFGQVDLLVNNAGINPKDYSDPSRMAKAFYLKDLDADEMLEVFRVNSLAPLLMTKHLRPLLRKSDRPVVLSISSWLGSVSTLSFGGHYGYVGSKNLLNVLNRSMAFELREEGIICVTVNPGWVQTDMGGSKARFTTSQSVSNLISQVLDRLTLADSGRFINYDGTDHPW